ncbi:MAG: rod-binding protein [Nitrospirae bacterium]|nr:rod-binding protein [Nitrospirota bacterium]
MNPINPSTYQPINLSTPSDHKKIAEAARGFEAYFVHQLLQEMRKTIPHNGNGFGGGFYEGLFDEALAEKVAQGDGIGMVKTIMNKIYPPSDKKV